MLLMVDWITAKIPFFYPGELSGGRVLKVSPDGSIEWETATRLAVVGSYDDKIQVRTAAVDPDGNTTMIEFSGNPVKWLQGHNVWGTSDILNLVYEFALALSATLGVPRQPDTVLASLRKGNYKVSRVDLNGMFELDNRQNVLSWIHAASATARTRQGTGVLRGDTVYFGKHSRRWSIKCYSKGQELEAHPPNIELPAILTDWANDKLRIELTLRSLELKQLGLNTAANWRTVEEADVYRDYVGRIEMAKQTVRDDLVLQIENKAARSTYQLWKDGHDVRSILPKPTFYRHRAALKPYGVDIAIKPPLNATANVVPLRRVIEMRPATLPHWAPGSEWLFEPRKIC